MKYNLAKEIDKQKLNTVIERDKRLGKSVEYKTLSKKRSLSINAYLHVLINYYAVEYGETADYIKTEIYKKTVNPGIYVSIYQNNKQGYTRQKIRSSADLSDKEMALSIDRFRNYAAKEAGMFLPPPDNKEFLDYCMNEIEKHKQYL